VQVSALPAFEHRGDEVEDVFGDDFVALGGGVGSVLLHHAINAVDAFKEEGEKRDGVLLGEQGVGLLELVDVVRAVVGREADAGESEGDLAPFQLREYGVEIRAGVFDAKAAEAVVAAELDDNKSGVQGDDVVDAIEAVFCCVSTDALVDDVIVKSASVEVLLEVVGVALAGIGPVAGGEAVAKADEERAFVGLFGRRGRSVLGAALWCH